MLGKLFVAVLSIASLYVLWKTYSAYVTTKRMLDSRDDIRSIDVCNVLDQQMALSTKQQLPFIFVLLLIVCMFVVSDACLNFLSIAISLASVVMADKVEKQNTLLASRFYNSRKNRNNN